jgi:proline dehydrogenase
MMMKANEAYEMTMKCVENKANSYLTTIEALIKSAAEHGRFYAWADKTFSNLIGDVQKSVIEKLKDAGYTVTLSQNDLLIKWEK